MVEKILHDNCVKFIHEGELMDTGDYDSGRALCDARSVEAVDLYVIYLISRSKAKQAAGVVRSSILKGHVSSDVLHLLSVHSTSCDILPDENKTLLCSMEKAPRRRAAAGAALRYDIHAFNNLTGYLLYITSTFFIVVTLLGNFRMGLAPLSVYYILKGKIDTKNCILDCWAHQILIQLILNIASFSALI